MESIRVSNLRCLADSTAIEIKPISLLVGANSSGKSTFLRVFPLLKQSHEMRSLGGLVLNEGDVNFGYFNEAIHKGAEPAELKITFGFTMQQGLYQGAQWNRFLANPMEANCELTYAKRAKDQRYPRLRAVLLTLKTGKVTDTIEISAEEEGNISKFLVNDLQCHDHVGSLRLRINRGIVPSLELALDKEGPDSAFDVVEPVKGPLDKRLLSETNYLFHGGTLRETRLAMFHSIPIGSPHEMLKFMRNAGPSTWQASARTWNIGSPTFCKVRNLLIAERMGDLLGSVNAHVTQLARSVHYFHPIRASVERDYLSRDVSVTAVDPSGINVAMVLASMSTEAVDKFRQWTRKYLGFEVFQESVGDGARIALRMKDVESGTEFNLADTGFGFSQMLPFLVQIWNLVEGRKFHTNRMRFVQYGGNTRQAIPVSYLIAIEQPELHLHPALQARLADLIVAMARLSKEENLPVRFMLETHSPTIIERIGQSIDNSGISPDDVQVVLFGPDKEHPGTNTSNVRVTSFDSEGVLRDWPFGFLSAPISVPAT